MLLHMVKSMFDCLRNCQTTFQSSYTVYIPPAVHEVSDCFASSPSLVIVCLLILCLWVWIGISLWFWFAVPWWLKVFSIFLCACLPFVCFSWRNAYSTSFPILKIGLLVFLLLSCKVFSYYGYDYLTTQVFSPTV